MQQVTMHMADNSSTAPAKKCPERVKSIVEQVVEDDVVLYDPRNDATHVLNTTAAAVWWLCDGELNSDEIVAEISRFFDTPLETVMPDVSKVLDEFKTAGLVRYP